MTKAVILAAALLISGAAFAASPEPVLDTEAKSADAMDQARCEHTATLKRYVGEQRKRFIAKCLASGRSKGKAVVRRPLVLPPDPMAPLQVAPLDRTRRPTLGGSVPSNAGVAPSAPVGGSSGTSTSGSSATSISGSSGTSIGSSRGR